MDRTATVRAYYEALDEGDYERLAGLLAPAFCQERPDRTFEGRDRFVEFVRDERPRTDTSHPIDAVFVRDREGVEAGGESKASVDGRVAVEGRLIASDGERIATFVDVFSFDGDRIAALRTYTR